MSRREADLLHVGHLIPGLLASIQKASELAPKDLFERLGGEMGLSPASLRRNWLRWSTVTETIDHKGRQARSDSLQRLVKAASKAGWLINAHRDGCAPLLETLNVLLVRSESEQQRAARQSLAYLRRQVRVALADLGAMSFDSPTWFIAVYQIVSAEVVRRLRERLLGGWCAPSTIPTELADDFLAGTITRIIGKIQDDGMVPLIKFKEEINTLELAALADFNASREDGFLK
ncbi:hypothetical protein RA210_U250047 [Rubrivivax sp. A210]|uniref:hypothetical protein n=1 Tax=Rubrivivax sp. A210 TaxID=2772301 RepID=UPI00191AD955|nr:hypothetical protein [Rubrivivax sp. A210]CAD5372948.1 hypothetical protein RA210_U250047 [Rubrivivax sp. A210]